MNRIAHCWMVILAMAILSFSTTAHAQAAEDSAPVAEDPSVEDPAPMVEDPSVEDPAPMVEDPAAEDPAPMVEDPAAEDPTPVAEDPAAEDPAPMAEDPTAEDPAPMAEDPTVDDPTVDDPTVDDPTVDDPTVDAPQENADPNKARNSRAYGGFTYPPPTPSDHDAVEITAISFAGVGLTSMVVGGVLWAEDFETAGPITLALGATANVTAAILFFYSVHDDASPEPEQNGDAEEPPLVIPEISLAPDGHVSLGVWMRF